MKLRKVTSAINTVVNLGEKMGLISLRFANRKTRSNVNMTSFPKEVNGVMGMQSPKHPQFLNLPDKYAYPVRKVKNMMSNNKSQMNNFICHPSNNAAPAMISNAIITIDRNRECS